MVCLLTLYVLYALRTTMTQRRSAERDGGQSSRAGQRKFPNPPKRWSLPPQTPSKGRAGRDEQDAVLLVFLRASCAENEGDQSSISDISRRLAGRLAQVASPTAQGSTPHRQKKERKT